MKLFVRDVWKLIEEKGQFDIRLFVRLRIVGQLLKGERMIDLSVRHCVSENLVLDV